MIEDLFSSSFFSSSNNNNSFLFKNILIYSCLSIFIIIIFIIIIVSCYNKNKKIKVRNFDLLFDNNLKISADNNIYVENSIL